MNQSTSSSAARVGKAIEWISRLLPWIAAATFAAFIGIHILDMVFTGDDYEYAVRYNDDACILRKMGRVWWNANARFGDLTNTLWLGRCPRWILASCCAGIFLLLFWSAKKMCRVSGSDAFGSTLLYAGLLLGLPWWDGGYMAVVQLNYTWAGALMLLWLWMLLRFRMQGKAWFWATPLAFLCCIGHEGVGIGVGAGLLFWIFMGKRWRGFTPEKRWLIIVSLIGCAFTLFAPGNLRKTGLLQGHASSLPFNYTHYAWWQTLLGGAWLVWLSAIVALWGWRRRPKVMHNLIRGEWGLLMVGALAGIPLLLISAEPGRGGWFCQLLGLCALFVECRALWPEVRLPKVCRLIGVWVLGILFVWQNAEAIAWQHRTDEQTRECLELFLQSDSDVVEMPYTGSEDLPWWLFGRVAPMSFDGSEEWNFNVLTHSSGRKLKVVKQAAATP